MPFTTGIKNNKAHKQRAEWWLPEIGGGEWRIVHWL